VTSELERLTDIFSESNETRLAITALGHDLAALRQDFADVSLLNCVLYY